MDAWVILVCVGVPMLFILGFVLLELLSSYATRPSTPGTEKLDHPVVAYKRAQLFPPSRQARAHDFNGVYGSSYGVVDHATSSHGFHAYDDFTQARNHPQPGNVFLEVVLSGQIHEHDLGWTATEQRVLQVIPHCSFSFTKTPCRVRPTVYFVQGGYLFFGCALHSGFAVLAALTGLTIPKPIAGLAARYPSFEEHGVMFAFESGDERFVPTKLPADAAVKS